MDRVRRGRERQVRGAAGKVQGTVAIWQAHPEALEADLQDRHYDIADVLTGRRSWRWLRVLIEHLPPESHTMTALRNNLTPEELAAQADKGEPEKGRWSQLELLLAAAYDRLGVIEYVLRCVNTDKKSKLPDPPEPMRRPGAGPRKKKAQLTDKSANTLFQLLQGGAA
ncbi:hypothetical protein [Streptomyces lancefieldiae]|uniref:Transposase n=1 Tax=Streptomyces lancefieldiae TaxID=3075520 RepID=A0ABU3AGG2_9ACTN|nr:hypothetical protein [Streptomyces sp. DSM 40712]MDT0608885.1 hypothetical protein [Streptomyces sp. DSM 40712]